MTQISLPAQGLWGSTSEGTSPLTVVLTEGAIQPKFPEKPRLPTDSISSSPPAVRASTSPFFIGSGLFFRWMSYLLSDCGKQRRVPYNLEERARDDCCVHLHSRTHAYTSQHTFFPTFCVHLAQAGTQPGVRAQTPALPSSFL